jgi:hypothetical protein
VLPPWFVKALIALVVIAIALVVIWLTLLKPSIESAASQAVASPLASLAANVNQALGNAGLPTMAPAGSSGAGGGASPSPTPPPSSPTGSNPPSTAPTPTTGVIIPGLGAPIDGRLDSSTTSVTAKGTLFITDFVFSNPNSRSGALVILRVASTGTSTLLQLRLDNFRDYDLHFVTPIVVTSGASLSLSLSCTSSPCDPAVFYSGYQRP